MWTVPLWVIFFVNSIFGKHVIRNLITSIWILYLTMEKLVEIFKRHGYKVPTLQMYTYYFQTLIFLCIRVLLLLVTDNV